MKQVGRILECSTEYAKAEFNEDAREGMIVKILRKGQRILGQIDRIETNKYTGIRGHVIFLQYLDRPFVSMTPIYVSEENQQTGLFHIGTDELGKKVNLPLDPLYLHTMVGGITQAGKTHFLLILCEEFVAHRVPCLVIDTNGEMVHLDEYAKGVGVTDYVHVVKEISMDNLMAHLQARHMVIIDLLGTPKNKKTRRVGKILTNLMEFKEKDYQKANHDSRFLQLPPILIIIDEADLYAPNKLTRKTYGYHQSKEPLIDIGERGAKFGVGMMLASQRVPRIDLDVRSQCNNAVIFHFTEKGSIAAIREFDYIPKDMISMIRTFEQGECIIAGKFVNRVRVIKTRGIKTRRSKNLDFSKMLGIEEPEEDEKEHKRQLMVTEAGDIVDTETGAIVEEGAKRLMDRDKAVYEAAEGDGVVKRDHLTPEEEAILKKLKK